MYWSKKHLWQIGVVGGGVLLLLMYLAFIPPSVASAHEKLSGVAARETVTMQATPTEDATVTALSKEKLAQEVQQLRDQNEPNLLGWLQANAALLLSTLVVVIGGLIGLFRWFGDRRGEREKRAEERFQVAVTGLGDDREGARIGSAILLRTFLLPGYEQFYIQVFDLAVAHLRLSRSSKPLEDPSAPLPLTALSQALIVIFKEAFPLARKQIQGSLQALDATGILLDNAYLTRADLKQLRMRQASLRNTNLYRATLSRARLFQANLTGADLSEADLSGADLGEANIEDARSLEKTNLRGVTGLTAEQLVICKAKGAIIDEDPTTSTFQSTVASPLRAQGNDVQTPSGSPAQGTS